MRLDDLADGDVVVTLLDDAGELALDRRQRRIEDRRAVAALVDGLAGELAVFERGRLEEGERHPLVLLAEHVQGEVLGGLDQRIGAGIGLHRDNNERRVEGALGHPIDGRRGNVALPVIRGQHIDPIGDHPQGGLFGVLVHAPFASVFGVSRR